MTDRYAEGYQKLWGWFGLSYASFCVMPRVLMHEMPDEWQSKMADLLLEYESTFDTSDIPSPMVTARKNNRFTSWPEWLLRYRRPDLEAVESRRINPIDETA